jgi:quercetin dioxygenase-like cupin family protein
MLKKVVICSVLLTFSVMALPSGAQQPPLMVQQTQNIKRTPLQKFDVPGINYETIIGLAEIVPNVNIGRHTHPGPESGFMLEGDFVLLVEGNAPLPVKAGESYKVPPGAIHDARTGANGAKVIATGER